jgi:hypothetical protein
MFYCTRLLGLFYTVFFWCFYIDVFLSPVWHTYVCVYVCMYVHTSRKILVFVLTSVSVSALQYELFCRPDCMSIAQLPTLVALCWSVCLCWQYSLATEPHSAGCNVVFNEVCEMHAIYSYFSRIPSAVFRYTHRLNSIATAYFIQHPPPKQNAQFLSLRISRCQQRELKVNEWKCATLAFTVFHRFTAEYWFWSSHCPVCF